MGNRVTELLKAKRRQVRHLALVLALAVLVAAAVGGIFHLPAIAKTYQKTVLACTAVPPTGPGYAGFFVHVHNDDCFDENGNQVCPLPEIKPHVHDESCYTTTAVLVCTLPESDGHRHTEDCYTLVKGDLICEESTEPKYNVDGAIIAEGHVHTDECFEWNKELSCGMEEGEGAHHHDDSCFEHVTTLTCDKPVVILHTHTDECYTVDEDENVYLTCGLPEVTEHVHGPECFTTIELDDGESEFVVMAEEPQPAEGGTQEPETGSEENTEEGAETGAETEETAKETAEETAETGTETVETGTETEETVPAVPMPAQSWERTAGGMKVTVEAPEGAFPENTKIAVTPVNGNSLKDTVSDAVNGEVLEVQAVDITFFDAAGQVIEPAVAIRVTMIPAETQNAEEKANVVHVDLEQQTAEVIAQAEGTENDNSEVVFDAEAFTIYAIVYTVHFEYEVDGETFTSASMPGAEQMPLAEVIRGLGIVSEEEVGTFVSKISTVASTNEDVAVVENTDAGLCVRVLKDGDAQIVITMQDGAQFRVDVVADGETATGNETATVSTLGDLYLPAEAKLEAKALDDVQSESAIAAVQAAEENTNSTAAAETVYQVFEISLENVEAEQYDGFQVEVKLPENVVGRDFRLFHIHDGVVDELEVKTEGYSFSGGTEQISRVSFVTDSFSEFVLQYTVDFEYEADGMVSYYSIEGGSTISLVDLLSYLGISISTDYIESVTVSNDRLISVTFEGGQWMLTSLMPFTSEETLAVSLVDGSTITIKIKDDQPVNLRDTITNVKVTLDGQEVPDGSPVVQGRLYNVIIGFEETDAVQFSNFDEDMYYAFPTGVRVPDISGTFEMDFGGLGKLKNNTYTVVDGVLHIHWNTSDTAMMNILRAADRAHFDIELATIFDQNTEVIEWNESVNTHLEVTDPHDVSVSKTGRYDSTDDKIHYTVTIESEGSTTGIKVTDTITGTALTSDVQTVNNITVTRHRNGTTETVTPTGFTKTDNGFVLNLPDMADGDTYVVEYTASVDYSKLGQSGKTTYLEANNGVKVETNEHPDDPKEDNSYEFEINYSSLKKTATGISEATEEDGKTYRTITWEIEANKELKVPVTEIKDSIRTDSREHMKMDGTGLTITVTKKDGTTETRNLSWGEDSPNGKLTKNDDYSWTYEPPEADGIASYKITYQTKAEVVTSGLYVANNDVTDDHGTTTSGVPVAPPEQHTIVKTVTSVTEQETEWAIDIAVPEEGTTNTRVTDTLPYYISAQDRFFDLYKSCTVTGLIEGEGYDISFEHRIYASGSQWNYQSVVNDDPTPPDGYVTAQVFIDFYHLDENNVKIPGLVAGQERNVHVTITTENNQEWLEAAAEADSSAYWNLRPHINRATFGDITVQAEAHPAIKKIQKDNNGTGKVKLNDRNEYTYYKYTLVLTDITDERNQIFDTFDTDVFEVLDLAQLDPSTYQYNNPFSPDSYEGHGRVDDGINATTYVGKDSHTAIFTPTSTGVVISTNGLDKTQSGDMYECYKISYYLVLKDPDLAEQKAFEAGGKITFTNHVDWDDAESEVDIEYGTPILDKDSEIDLVNHKAKFTIVINPNKMKIGVMDANGHYPDTLTLKDTFSNALSIDYSSIQITTDPDPASSPVTYDYSGNTGTFVIPNQTKVVITYECRIISTGNVQIFNRAILDGKYEDYTEEYKVVESEVHGSAQIIYLNLLKYAKDHMEQGSLAGAVFRLLDSEKNPVRYTARIQNPASTDLIGKEITFTTDNLSPDGMVWILLSQYDHGITLKRNTVYYLEEIVAPTGMQLDPTLYSFVISDDPTHANYSRDDGIWVYYEGDILKIRNTPETLQLQIMKRFGGNVELTQEQKNKIHFLIQQVDENGNVVSGGFQKDIAYSDMRYDKYSITDEVEGFVAGYYKVTEYHEDLGLPDNVVYTTSYTVTKGGTTENGDGMVVPLAAVSDDKTTNIIFTNKYSTGAYYFTKLDAGTEQPVAGAKFTVYNYTNNDELITTYTTGEDGKFMITGETPEHSVYLEGNLYYVIETEAADGYVIPDPAPKYYFYFGTTVPAGAEEHDAINLSSADSESTHQTVLNTPETSIMVKKEWKNAGGTPLSEEEIKNKTINIKLKRYIEKTSTPDAVTVTVNVTSLISQYEPVETISFNDVKRGSSFTIEFSNVARTNIGYQGSNIELTAGAGSIHLDSVTGDTTIELTKDSYETVISWITPVYDSVTSATGPSYRVIDDTFEETQTLSIQNNWYYLWSKLPKESEAGEPYYYYVEESTGSEEFTISYSNNTGIQTGTITITNTKKEDEKGALKLKKLVTVNGQATTGTAADGTYTFTITDSATPAAVVATVEITVENGVAVSATVDGQAVNLVDGFVVISDLDPGDYTITETTPTNGTSISKINDQPTTTLYSTTVTVVAGDTTAVQASATFTNNIDFGSLEITKNIQTNGATDPSKTGTFYYAVYSKAYTAENPPTPVRTGSVTVTANGASSATESDLPYGTYYVYELTEENGTPIVDGNPTVINNTIYTVTGSGTSAAISSSATQGSVALTNNVETTDVSVEKKWKPAIPENTTITLGLYSGKTAAAATTQVTTIVLDGTADTAAVNINGNDTKAGTKQENPGWTAEFKSLPKYAYDTNGVYEIQYVVKETSAPEGYTVSYEGDGTYVITGGTITNTKNPGDLELTKKVAGGGDANKEFEFTIELTAPAGWTLESSYSATHTGDSSITSVTLTNGKVEGIKLKADETFTIVGLPAGTTYKITETDYSADGYSASANAAKSPLEGTITGGEKAKEEVEITNTYSAGGLTVEKVISGNDTNNEKQFSFEVEFVNAEMAGKTQGTWTKTNETPTSISFGSDGDNRGKAKIEFTLKGGEKVEFNTLPSGTTFTVKETSADLDGYETTVETTGGTPGENKSVTGTISTSAAITVKYTNTKNKTDIEATKVWKNGETIIAWPEDVESVEFTLYKTVNGVTTAVAPADLTNYWTDPTTFTNPISVNKDTEGKKASWADLPTRMLVTTTETVAGTEVTTTAWYDVSYSVKETKVTFTAASGKEPLVTEEAINAAYNPTTWDVTDKTITNTPTTSIHVTKEWQKEDGTVIAAPEGASVIFTLYAGDNKVTKPAAEGGAAVDRTVTLNGTDETAGGTVTPTSDDYEGTDWTAYFTNLPVYDSDGKVITYTVRETGTWTGFVLVTTGDGITYPAVNNGKIINKESSLSLDILKEDTAGTVITTGATFRLVQVYDSNQVDEVSGTEQTGTTGTDGKLTFSNLKVGYYKITELTPPPGYVLPSDATFYVKVTETEIKLLIKGEGLPSTWDSTQTSGGVVKTFTLKTETANAQATVENTSGTALPQTGGIGTTLFTALGGLMTVTAGAILTMRRGKRKTAEG